MTDMQGRLQGKRLAATHFLDDVLEHNAEGCNYLLAVDVDMNTVSGYAMSSWDRGYGDFVFKPDLSTLRMVPWQEGTALVMCDLEWEDGSPVLASPRGVLRRQLERLAERGWVAYVGHRARVHRVPRQLRGGLGQGLPRPAPGQRLQRRLLAAGHGPDRAAAAPHPQLHGRGRHAGRVGQGRVQLRPARDRLPLHRRPGHRRRARHLQERGQGDRRPGRLQPDLHGQVQRARGQLLPHPLQPARRRRRRRRSWQATAATTGTRS